MFMISQSNAFEFPREWLLKFTFKRFYTPCSDDILKNKMWAFIWLIARQ